MTTAIGFQTCSWTQGLITWPQDRLLVRMWYDGQHVRNIRVMLHAGFQQVVVPLGGLPYSKDAMVSGVYKGDPGFRKLTYNIAMG